MSDACSSEWASFFFLFEIGALANWMLSPTSREGHGPPVNGLRKLSHRHAQVGPLLIFLGNSQFGQTDNQDQYQIYINNSLYLLEV